MSDGEPRWQNRGIVDAEDGCSQEHRGSFGIVSMEDVSGRRSCSLFTGRVGEAISAELNLTIARAWWENQRGDGGVRGGPLETIVRSHARCGGEYPLQGARADRRSAWSVVKRTRHQHHGRKLDRGWYPSEVKGSRQSTCDWHSSVVCIFDRIPRALKDERAVRPSFGQSRRTVDADDGQGRCERVLDAGSGVESRTGVHSRGRKVSVERHDGRRSGCGDGHP
jgi:hypothetical protein